MRIYHGSSNIIEAPEFMSGKKNNDYGKGFYTTNIPDLAREWAVNPNQDGYLNIYELDTKDLKFVDLNQSCYTILNWMALLYKNRSIYGLERHKERLKDFLDKFLPDISEADIVIGHRADDRYFRFGKLFIRNDLSLKNLEEVLLLGDLGQQIFLKSQESFKPERLNFLGYEHVLSQEWYFKKAKRERKANKIFKAIENAPRIKEEITINDILEKDGWKYARPASDLSDRKVQIPDDCIILKAAFQIETELYSQNKQNGYPSCC